MSGTSIAMGGCDENGNRKIRLVSALTPSTPSDLIQWYIDGEPFGPAMPPGPYTRTVPGDGQTHSIELRVISPANATGDSTSMVFPECACDPVATIGAIDFGQEDEQGRLPIRLTSHLEGGNGDELVQWSMNGVPLGGQTAAGAFVHAIPSDGRSHSFSVQVVSPRSTPADTQSIELPMPLRQPATASIDDASLLDEDPAIPDEEDREAEAPLVGPGCDRCGGPMPCGCIEEGPQERLDPIEPECDDCGGVLDACDCLELTDMKQAETIEPACVCGAPAGAACECGAAGAKAEPEPGCATCGAPAGAICECAAVGNLSDPSDGCYCGGNFPCGICGGMGPPPDGEMARPLLNCPKCGIPDCQCLDDIDVQAVATSGPSTPEGGRQSQSVEGADPSCGRCGAPMAACRCEGDPTHTFVYERLPRDVHKLELMEEIDSDPITFGINKVCDICGMSYRGGHECVGSR